MSLVTFIRDLQKIPERIPGPAAVAYNAIAAKLLKKSELEIARLIASKITGGTIVDLGSGTGYLSIEIARLAPALSVYGIDLSGKMIDISRRAARGLPNVRFELSNVATLPFNDSSIDFITSTGSMHHWKHPLEVFDECYRVLKPGGEGWIFDGYPDFVKIPSNRSKPEYGFLRRKIASAVLRLHGFTDKEYRTTIAHILDRSRFRDHYRMEPAGIWMKIVIQKEL